VSTCGRDRFRARGTPVRAALGERHGFDVWRLVGATWQTAIRGQAALGADVDQSALEGHIATMTTLLGCFRASGGNLFCTAYTPAADGC
jgi:hypothetical protein